MYRLDGKPNEGTWDISKEKVFIKGKTEVHLQHDVWISLKVYADEEMTTEISTSLYSADDYDADYKGYNLFVPSEELKALYDYVFVSYKTRGDYNETKDINNLADKIAEYECGEDIIAFRAVMLSEGKIYYPDIHTADIRKIIGVSLDSGGQHERIRVSLNGEITDVAWDWDLAKDIFVGENGRLTQGCPTGNIKIIAVPVGVKTLRIVEISEIIRE